MLFKLHTVDDLMLDCGIQKIEDNMKRAGAHCVALVVPQGSVSTEGEGGDIHVHVHVAVHVMTIRY